CARSFRSCSLPMPAFDPPAFDPLIEQSCEKYCEWFYVLIYACRLKCCHIVASSVNGNDGPLVSTRCRHEVHEEAAHAAVAVRIGMYVDEHEMPENHAHR